MIAAAVFALAGVIALVLPTYSAHPSSDMGDWYMNVSLAVACFVVAGLLAAGVIA